jgi:hypothetical protein
MRSAGPQSVVDEAGTPRHELECRPVTLTEPDRCSSRHPPVPAGGAASCFGPMFAEKAQTATSSACGLASPTCLRHNNRNARKRHDLAPSRDRAYQLGGTARGRGPGLITHCQQLRLASTPVVDRDLALYPMGTRHVVVVPAWPGLAASSPFGQRRCLASGIRSLRSRLVSCVS